MNQKDNEPTLNKYGVNNAIKYHILPDEKMRKIGFTDYNPDNWYFCRCIKEDVTFGVTIPKNGIDDIRIDVLDENFCQPYDYQYILDKKPTFQFALDIKQKVEELMEYLQSEGVLSGHVKGDYI